MPALSDYIGALLAEITNARLQADLESARIAELYALHPLLQHMPIPRFRLPNVILDLPVAVEKLEPASGSKLHPPDLRAMRSKIDGIIEQKLKQLKLEVPSNLRDPLTGDLDRLFKELTRVGRLSPSEALMASDEAVTSAMEAIRASNKEHSTVDASVESSLQRQFSAEFLKLQLASTRVQVLVETTQLKELAPPATVTRIRLTISEEGVEWTQSNPEDSSSKTLLPE